MSGVKVRTGKSSPSPLGNCVVTGLVLVGSEPARVPVVDVDVEEAIVVVVKRCYHQVKTENLPRNV